MSQNSSAKKLLFTLIKIVLVVVVLYFVYRQLAKNIDEVKDYEWQINWLFLTLSIITHLVTFLLFSKVWCWIIDAFGYRVRLADAFKISYISNLGRYVPGKIWPVMGMTYLAKKLGIGEEKAITSWIIAQIFTLPAAFCVGLVSFLVVPEMFADLIEKFSGAAIYLVIASAFLISLFLIFIPNRFFALFNKFLKLIKRPPIQFKMSIATALRIYLGYFICWTLYGVAFWMLLVAITSNFTIPLIPSIGAFVIAYQIGYLAFFAPGGLGVRELVLISVTAPFLGPISAGVAVAARVWNLVVEICAFVTASMIKMKGTEK